MRAAPVDRDVDLVALSFFSGFAREAYAIADRYRANGVTVIAGGPHSLLRVGPADAVAIPRVIGPSTAGNA